MPVDPEIRALLERLDAQGSLPLVRETAAESREHYRLLALARRSSPGTIVPMRAVETSELSDPGGSIGLRSFVPVNDQGNCVITYLHGGGWVLGDLDTHDAICRRAAEATGAVVVAVDYRLAPEHPHPGPLDSVMLALRWSASQHPGRRHAVMGDSAGASLAAAAAIRGQRRRWPLTECPSAPVPGHRSEHEHALHVAEWQRVLPDQGRHGMVLLPLFAITGA